MGPRLISRGPIEATYSDDAVAIARKLEGKPTEITKAFRQYANDEALSRPDAPMTMGFEPPTRKDAFQSAFGEPKEAGTRFAEALPNENRLTPREQTLERMTHSRALGGIRKYVRQYRERFGDHFSSDKAAELFPEYAASEATRTENRAAVTKASHLVADRAFADRLGEPDKTPVAFVIGGPGAGKTTSAGSAINEGAIVFDGSAVHAERLIGEAVATGRKVNIEYIHRDPVDAFRGTLDRAMNSPTERGRVIPIRLHEELHRGSAQAIQRIQEKYADNPNVRTTYVVNRSTEPPRASDSATKFLNVQNI